MVDGPAGSSSSSSAISSEEIAKLIAEVDKVVEDALAGSTSLTADLVVFGTAAAGAAAEIGWIPNTTLAIASAAITVGIPAIARVIALIRHGHKTKVKVAALQALAMLKR